MDNSKTFEIKLPIFEGPLDILWNLIKKSKLDITQISLSQITSEYMNYLNMLKKLDVDIASEFVFMASTLLHYKSLVLLPVENELSEDYDPPLPPELVHQLLEYKKYQDAARKMDEMAAIKDMFFTKPVEQFVFDFAGEENAWQEISLLELISAFTRIANSMDVKLTQAIEIEDITVEKSIANIIQKLKTRNSFVFSELFSGNPSKIELVTTFLAVLELVRMREVSIRQHQLFGEIRIFYRESEQPEN